MYIYIYIYTHVYIYIYIYIYKAQRELISTYQKEQIGYIQGQINKIRNSIEDR